MRWGEGERKHGKMYSEGRGPYGTRSRGTTFLGIIRVEFKIKETIREGPFRSVDIITEVDE